MRSGAEGPLYFPVNMFLQAFTLNPKLPVNFWKYLQPSFTVKENTDPTIILNTKKNAITDNCNTNMGD